MILSNMFYILDENKRKMPIMLIVYHVPKLDSDEVFFPISGGRKKRSGNMSSDYYLTNPE